MKRIILTLAFGISLATSGAYGAAAVEPGEDADGPIVVMETSMGNIRIQLDPHRAPITVDNFLGYVNSGFYGGTVFHRVVKNFVIQGGRYTADLQEKPTNPPIRNEAGNGLKNNRGTIAMARGVAVDSATSEFFINVSNNPILNHKDDTIQGHGYAVFGKVIEGMKVVDRIAAVGTGKRKGMRFVPKTPVMIRSMRVVR